jgi:hypothetical protein
MLTDLSGRADDVPNQYLYRFRLPSTTTGNVHRVYTLGARGREYLEGELGITCPWQFRPEKVKLLSYSQVLHALLLTRFCIGLSVWSRNADIALLDMRLSYELSGQFGKHKVIPDAWLLFEKEREKHPFLLEIDRGMEHQVRFKDHVRARLEFIRSGEYKRMFGIEAVTVCYVTTGQKPEYRESRVRAMEKWTREVLTAQKRENWLPMFRFYAAEYEALYDTFDFTRLFNG